ncbi:hypothetical protein JCM8547_004872 [Rhodosporidiobolus lusitaniae]
MQTRLEKACSPASPVSSRPKDHLSCLPPELIGEIFSLAYPPDEPGPSFPLSRHLLPFFLETVYECITITGFDKLDAFCKTLVGALLVASSSSHSASVLTYIEGAKVDLKKEAKDSGTTTNKTLTTVFKLLKNLRNFASLHSTFADVGDPFHLSLYINLVFYDKLVSFILVVDHRPPKSIKSLAKLPDKEKTLCLLPFVFHVLLDGPLSSSPSPPDLVGALTPPLLVNLRLESLQARYDQALTEALLEVLRHLTFGADAAVSTDGLEALVSGSRKHPSLKHLTLGNVYPVFDDEDDEDDEPEPEQYISYITWTNIFDEVGLVNLLDAARKAGVEVDGEALHALEWEQQEDEEFFREHGCG